MFILILCSLPSFSQIMDELRGNVINSVTKEPVQGVVVILRGHNYSTTTDAEGMFRFVNVKPGDDVIALSSANIISREIPITIEVNHVKLLKDIPVTVNEVTNNQALIGVIDEASLGDDDGELMQDVSSMVILSNDIYLSNASYQFSPFRFKVRGYDNTYDTK